MNNPAINEKEELFDLIKGPFPMKDLCEKYKKFIGYDFFKDWLDNGDCEHYEIDWLYSGSIEHAYDGDLYLIELNVRDPYDKEITTYPEISFNLEFINSSGFNYLEYPILKKIDQVYYIKTFKDFVNAVKDWPDFVTTAIDIIEKDRLTMEKYFSPAPDMKEFYHFVKHDFAHILQDRKNDILNLKKE